MTTRWHYIQILPWKVKVQGHTKVLLYLIYIWSVRVSEPDAILGYTVHKLKFIWRIDLAHVTMQADNWGDLEIRTGQI